MSERNWHDIILPDYEIRKTKAQKTRFIEMLREKYGDRLTVQETKSLPKSRNIIIGDPEKAKTVFTAHYDTCPVMPFPNFITPLNIPVYILYQLLITVIIYLPIVILIVLVSNLAKNVPEPWGLLIYEVTLFGALFGIMALLLAGPANRHTVNDNTSGVISVLTLADRIDSPDVAFILFDNEEKGMQGSAAYAKEHKRTKANTLIVNLDCVSDGDTLLFVPSKKAKDGDFCEYLAKNAASVFSEYGKEAKIAGPRGVVYPSDQTQFKNSVGIAALKTSKHRMIGLYMDKIHTKHDTVYDERNISALTALLEGAVNTES